MPELGLGHLLARRLAPASVLIALVISLLPPAAFYLLQYRGLERAATVRAEDVAEKLRDVVFEAGPRWPHEVMRLRHLWPPRG